MIKDMFQMFHSSNEEMWFKALKKCQKSTWLLIAKKKKNTKFKTHAKLSSTEKGINKHNQIFKTKNEEVSI